MKSFSKPMAVAAVIALGLLSLASLAWACSGQSNIAFAPQAGPAGTNLTVQGAGFLPGQVELRWDGVSGPLIGEGTVDLKTPQFYINGVIPDVAPGVHYVVALQRAMAGGIFLKAVDTFEVTSGSARATKEIAGTDLWSGFDAKGSAQVSNDPAVARATGKSPTNWALGLALAGAGTLGLMGFASAAFVRARKRTSSTH